MMHISTLLRIVDNGPTPVYKQRCKAQPGDVPLYPDMSPVHGELT